MVYTFTDTAGTLNGNAAGKAETVPLTDIVCAKTADGRHVTWWQSVTRPVRLNLEFDVTAAGDTLAGHSWAGRLPRSTVPGMSSRW